MTDPQQQAMPPKHAIKKLISDLRQYGAGFDDGPGVFGDAVKTIKSMQAEIDRLGALAASAPSREVPPGWKLVPTAPVAEPVAPRVVPDSAHVGTLRWLLNLTTEFDRKDVRTRQAARLLDDFTDKHGRTNRENLEALCSWCDGLINAERERTGKVFPAQCPPAPEEAKDAAEQVAWTDAAILSLLRRNGDGSFGEEDIATTRRFMQHAEEVRAELSAPPAPQAAPEPVALSDQARWEVWRALHPTGKSDGDAQDAKRWRFIARHWHSAHVSFNKKPNTLKLMRLTIRTDYTKPREGAEAIEREIDAVIAAKGLE